MTYCVWLRAAMQEARKMKKDGTTVYNRRQGSEPWAISMVKHELPAAHQPIELWHWCEAWMRAVDPDAYPNIGDYSGS
jgi:hypothetical protein